MRNYVGLLLLFLLIFTGCGKRGALIYPDMLAPETPPGVSARQSGKAVKLSFALSNKNLAGRDLKEPGTLEGADVYRRSSLAGQAPECSACREGFTLWRKLYIESLPSDPDVQRYGNTVIFLDGDVKPGEEYSYMVGSFTKDSVNGKLSAPVAVAVAEPLDPPVLTAEPGPVEILLHFEGSYADRGTLEGYNIYRTINGQAFSYAPLNKEPIEGGEFADIGLERDVSYTYAVRAVVRTPDGQLMESGLSNEAVAKLTDE